MKTLCKGMNIYFNVISSIIISINATILKVTKTVKNYV